MNSAKFSTVLSHQNPTNIPIEVILLSHQNAQLASYIPQKPTNTQSYPSQIPTDPQRGLAVQVTGIPHQRGAWHPNEMGNCQAGND